MPSVDGDAVTSALFTGVLASDGSFAFPDDRMLSERTDHGWTTRTLATTLVHGPLGVGDVRPNQFTADLKTSTWFSTFPLVTSDNPVGTPPTPAGSYLYTRFPGERGFELFLPPAAQQIGAAGLSEFSPDGTKLIKFGQFRGLLGSEDPTLKPPPSGQASGVTGGYSIYREDLDSGVTELINGCTGTGLTATQIPERLASGKLAAQPCEEGSVTSQRGATLGGSGVGTVRRFGGMTSTAVSTAGDRIFFMSPDQGSTNQPSQATVGCIPSGTGPSTVCQPQLFVWQKGSDNQPRVRWISRPKVSDQDATLLGYGAGFEGASSEGDIVYFRSNAPLTPDDPNGLEIPADPELDPRPIKTGSASNLSWDLFQYKLPAGDDPAGGELVRITAGPAGDGDPNTICSGLTGANCHTAANGGVLRHLSEDGKRAYFVTASPIPGVPTNDAPDNGTSTTAGGSPNANVATRNLYVYNEEEEPENRWRFIAELPFAGRAAALDNINACATSSEMPGPIVIPKLLHDASKSELDRSSCFRGNRNGSMVVFQTTGQLTPDDTDDALDVYAYDADENQLTRLSAPRLNEEPYVCVMEPTVLCNGSLGEGAYHWGQNLYGDQLRHFNVTEEKAVYFESQLSLHSDDVNGHSDVYEWKDGALSLISPGTSDHHAFFSGAMADGRDVFIFTSEPLDPWRETDSGDYDVYDVRRGGGFPPPEAATPCDVMEDMCHEAPTSSPTPLGIQTNQIKGTANVAPSRCRFLGERTKKSNARARQLKKRAARATGIRRQRLKRASRRATRRAVAVQKRHRACLKKTGANR